jgi:hypothetical protein
MTQSKQVSCASYRYKKDHICGQFTRHLRILGSTPLVCMYHLRIDFDRFLIDHNVVTIYMSKCFSSRLRKCKNHDNVVHRTWDVATQSFVSSNTCLHEWNKIIKSDLRIIRQNRGFKEPTMCSRKRDMQDTTTRESGVAHYLGWHCYHGGMHGGNVLTSEVHVTKII